MKVLLISANTERGNMIVMPLGLALVAEATRRAGHDVQFLDLMAAADPVQAVADAIETFTPEAIGISVRNIDDQSRESPRFLLDQVKPVVAECRRRSPAAIILGGAGYTIFPDAALRYLGADYGIAGEAEAAFPQLLECLEKHEWAHEIPGVHSAAGIATSQRRRGDLDSFPFWSQDLDRWYGGSGADLWCPVQTRRGCPNDCSYCSTAAIQGRRIRRRSPSKVAEEVVRLREAGFRKLFFVDNSFNIPDHHALDLCTELTRLRVDVEWRCILYPHLVTETLVAAMARAGCVEVSLGFESGNRHVLRQMNKRYSPEDVRATSDLLARHGIRRMGFLLLGGPGETPESVEESLAFAESLRLDSLRVTVGIRIYPHTALARRAVAEGVIDSRDDLLQPRFYLAPGLEPWIHERVVAGLSTSADASRSARL